MFDRIVVFYYHLLIIHNNGFPYNVFIHIQCILMISTFNSLSLALLAPIGPLSLLNEFPFSFHVFLFGSDPMSLIRVVCRSTSALPVVTLLKRSPLPPQAIISWGLPLLLHDCCGHVTHRTESSAALHPFLPLLCSFHPLFLDVP